MPFQAGNKHGKGRKQKLENATIWLKSELEKEGVDITKLLAAAVIARDFDMIEALTRLLPHIANKPKETHALDGISGLVVKEFKAEEPK